MGASCPSPKKPGHSMCAVRTPVALSGNVICSGHWPSVAWREEAEGPQTSGKGPWLSRKEPLQEVARRPSLAVHPLWPLPRSWAGLGMLSGQGSCPPARTDVGPGRGSLGKPCLLPKHLAGLCGLREGPQNSSWEQSPRPPGEVRCDQKASQQPCGQQSCLPRCHPGRPLRPWLTCSVAFFARAPCWRLCSWGDAPRSKVALLAAASLASKTHL